MKVFGITGGIGSGKSTASSIFAELGVPVVDADDLSRRAVAPGTPGLAQVVRDFGSQVVGPDGGLDRKMMGELVFASVAMRAKLGAIIHPIIRDLAEEEFRRLEGAGVTLAAYDCPLLFESGLQAEFEPTVVINVGEEEQVRRVMARNGLTEAAAKARIASQMPLAEKVRMADIVIDNTGDIRALRKRVEIALLEVSCWTA